MIKIINYLKFTLIVTEIMTDHILKIYPAIEAL
jgi:hypothetical protein